MIITTTKHSLQSSIALGQELGCSVVNLSEQPFPSTYNGTYVYNMGCGSVDSYVGRNKVTLNTGNNVRICIDKIRTFELLRGYGVLVVPWTKDINLAKQWFDKDKIIVNRTRIKGKAGEGMSFSYKPGWWTEEVPINEGAKFWTRYVNHTRELRAYVFRGFRPLVFEKRRNGDAWEFVLTKTTNRLAEQLQKAQEANDELIFSAYDILECVTGDYYFLENNSAPSLLVHSTILPKLVKTINYHTKL